MHFGFGFMHVACKFQLNLVEEMSIAAQISMVVIHTELFVFEFATFNSSEGLSTLMNSLQAVVKFATPHKQQS